MSQKVIDRIKAKFPDAVIDSGVALGDAFAAVKRGSYFDVVKFLKEDPDCLMNHFIDLTCVDWPDREDRFEVVLHLRSQALNHRVRIKTVAAAVDPSVASVVPIFRGANWFERRGHVALARRIRLALAQGAGEEAGMANLLLGQGAWDRGRYDEALPFYERAERLLKGQKLSVRGPGGEELGFRLTVCEAARDAAEGRDAQAISALRRLLAERSDYLEAAALLTNLLRRRGDHEEADAVADRTIAALSVPIERGNGRAHDCNAVAWFMALTDTDLEEAERLSRLSLDMDAGNPAYLDTLAEIAFRRDDPSRAVKLIRDALVQRPENRAYFEAQLGKFQHALERPKQSAE